MNHLRQFVSALILDTTLWQNICSLWLCLSNVGRQLARLCIRLDHIATLLERKLATENTPSNGQNNRISRSDREVDAEIAQADMNADRHVRVASASEVYHAALMSNSSLDDLLASFGQREPLRYLPLYTSHSEPEMENKSRLEPSENSSEQKLIHLSQPSPKGKCRVRHSPEWNKRLGISASVGSRKTEPTDVARCVACEDSPTRLKPSALVAEQVVSAEDASPYHVTLSHCSSRSSIPRLSRAR